MPPDLYKILQVDPAADVDVIEAAFRRLARKYHPDVSRLPDAAERMRELNEARDVLVDPVRRCAYDLSREAARGRRPRRERRRYGRSTDGDAGVADPGAEAPQNHPRRRTGRPRRRAAPGGHDEPRAARTPRRLLERWRGLLRRERRVLVAASAAMSASMLLAALAAQLFRGTALLPEQTAVGAVVLVTSRAQAIAEQPFATEGQPLSVPTTTPPPAWPPPVSPSAPAASNEPSRVGLFLWLRNAADKVSVRLSGPVPPERPAPPRPPT